MLNIKVIPKEKPWSDYINSIPMEDVRGIRSPSAKFSVLLLTTESYNHALNHPDLLYRGLVPLEVAFDVDCIAMYHEDSLLEFDVHSRYMHTGTRRFLKL